VSKEVCPSLGLEGGHEALEYLDGGLEPDAAECLRTDLPGQPPDLVPNPGDITQ
jgi:hypothetical protein